jgi:hypothetical protein
MENLDKPSDSKRSIRSDAHLYCACLDALAARVVPHELGESNCMHVYIYGCKYKFSMAGAMSFLGKDCARILKVIKTHFEFMIDKFIMCSY